MLQFNEVLVGDFIQARKTAVSPTGETQVLITEFTVTGIVGTVIQGSAIVPIGIDPKDGWTLELISRKVTMPTVASEIIATRFDDVEVRIVGKDKVWTDLNTGQPVRPRDFKKIKPAS